MKARLIKKATPKIKLPVVGNRVRISYLYQADGNGNVGCNKYYITVTKVNKVTFDGADDEGNVYRFDARRTNFEVVDHRDHPSTTPKGKTTYDNGSVRWYVEPNGSMIYFTEIKSPSSNL